MSDLVPSGPDNDTTLGGSGSLGNQAANSAPSADRDQRFLDEAGDTAFYGSKRRVIVGTPGVSKAFYLGCVKFKCSLADARLVVMDAQRRVRENPALTRFQSVQKRLAKGGFHFHAKIDPPPVKELFFEALRDLSCSLEIIVARKDPRRFARAHHDKEDQFYADILGHLLKNKLRLGGRLTMTIAQRGSATRSINLDRALAMALERALRKNERETLATRVVFDVTEPTREVLLTVADDLSWSVQRVFETGDTTFYDVVRDRVSVVQDIWDVRNFGGRRNWYGPKRPLTSENKLSPPTP
jgi:hypothetical protein